MTNEVLNTMKTRRSCRCYLDKMPEPEALNAVLEAGTWAPTGMGRQSPVIVCIQNKADRDTLSKMNAAVMGGNGDPFYGAPCVAVVLVDKTMQALREHPVSQLVIAGGVAANQGLREAMTAALATQFPEVDVVIPPVRLTGDNAAMIGAAAHIELAKQHFADETLNAVPNLNFARA